MSRLTELPAPWTACGALRMGNTACAQAVVLARLLGLMHVCFACICCCLCFLLPIRSRKSVPCCRFALCDMNLFMCFVLPSLLLSKSRISWRSILVDAAICQHISYLQSRVHVHCMRFAQAPISGMYWPQAHDSRFLNFIVTLVWMTGPVCNCLAYISQLTK